MRVLIGCEFSGTMRDAFAMQGYDAWSCDVIDDDDGRHQRMWLQPPSKDRWKIRSTTYTGIAKACADQWGKHVAGRVAA